MKIEKEKLNFKEFRDLSIPANRMLEQREKTQKELKKNVSENQLYLDLIQHDLGNIHQAIKGFIELSLRANPQMKQVLCEKAHSSVLQAEKLTGNLKKLKALESLGETKSTINLSPVLNEAAERAKALHVGTGPFQ